MCANSCALPNCDRVQVAVLSRYQDERRAARALLLAAEMRKAAAAIYSHFTHMPSAVHIARAFGTLVD